MAKGLPGAKAGYLNWDIAEDRERILRREMPSSNPPRAFENLIASHLLKWVHFEQDTQGRDVELRYFRDVDGREVDFVVVERGRPLVMVEAKWSDADVDRGIRYLKERFRSAAAWQVSAKGTKDFVTPDGIRVAPALELLRTLV